MADTLRIKRRAAGGAAGAPTSLAAAELAYNEQDDTLYYGKGNSGGNATSILAIAGPGSFPPGTQWRSGVGAPSNSLGIDGDLYLNTSNDDLYQRSGGVYTVISNIKGAAGPSGGDIALLASGTITAGSASLDIVLTSYTAYRGLMIYFSNFQPTTDTAILRMRFSTNGGTSFDSAAASYSHVHHIAEAVTPSDSASGSTSATSIDITGGIGSTAATGRGFNGAVTMMDQTNTAEFSAVTWQGKYRNSIGTLASVYGTGTRLTAQDTDAWTFLMSTGTIAQGKWALYGLK
jgi:hypothetical protein